MRLRQRAYLQSINEETIQTGLTKCRMKLIIKYCNGFLQFTEGRRGHYGMNDSQKMYLPENLKFEKTSYTFCRKITEHSNFI